MKSDTINDLVVSLFAHILDETNDITSISLEFEILSDSRVECDDHTISTLNIESSLEWEVFHDIFSSFEDEPPDIYDTIFFFYEVSILRFSDDFLDIFSIFWSDLARIWFADFFREMLWILVSDFLYIQLVSDDLLVII
jgi:hypothetical protein